MDWIRSKYQIVKIIREQKNVRGVYFVRKSPTNETTSLKNGELLVAKYENSDACENDVRALNYFRKINVNVPKLVDNKKFDGKYSAVVYEYVEGFTLKELLEEHKVSDQQLILILINIAKLIEMLEKANVTVYDFWEENVVVAKDQVFLIDLSNAHQYTKEKNVRNWCIDHLKRCNQDVVVQNGYTPDFQIGKDLNNLLGELLHYNISIKMKTIIGKVVKRRTVFVERLTNYDEYKINFPNPSTSGEKMIEMLENIKI